MSIQISSPLIIILLLMFPLSLISQNEIYLEESDYQWQKLYGGSEDEVMNDFVVVKENNSDYLIGVGFTKSENGLISMYKGGRSDWWIIKLDSEGELVWEKTFGVDDWESYTESAYSIEILDDGNYFVYWIGL